MPTPDSGGNFPDDVPENLREIFDGNPFVAIVLKLAPEGNGYTIHKMAARGKGEPSAGFGKLCKAAVGASHIIGAYTPQQLMEVATAIEEGGAMLGAEVVDLRDDDEEDDEGLTDLASVFSRPPLNRGH